MSESEIRVATQTTTAAGSDAALGLFAAACAEDIKVLDPDQSGGFSRQLNAAKDALQDTKSASAPEAADAESAQGRATDSGSTPMPGELSDTSEVAQQALAAQSKNAHAAAEQQLLAEGHTQSQQLIKNTVQADSAELESAAATAAQQLLAQESEPQGRPLRQSETGLSGRIAVAGAEETVMRPTPTPPTDEAGNPADSSTRPSPLNTSMQLQAPGLLNSVSAQQPAKTLANPAATAQAETADAAVAAVKPGGTADVTPAVPAGNQTPVSSTSVDAEDAPAGLIKQPVVTPQGVLTAATAAAVSEQTGVQPSGAAVKPLAGAVTADGVSAELADVAQSAAQLKPAADHTLQGLPHVAVGSSKGQGANLPEGSTAAVGTEIESAPQLQLRRAAMTGIAQPEAGNTVQTASVVTTVDTPATRAADTETPLAAALNASQPGDTPATPASLSSPSAILLPGSLIHATSSGLIAASDVSRISSFSTDLVSAPAEFSLQQSDAEQPFIENVRWMLGEQLKRATVNVTPANLGPMTIHVDVENQNMSVSIVASNAMVKEAVDTLLPRIRDTFEGEGYEQVSVDVFTQSEQGHAGGRENEGRNSAFSAGEADAFATTETPGVFVSAGFSGRGQQHSLIDTYV